MADDDGWTCPGAGGHRCQPHMVEFMSFLHGAHECDAKTVFTGAELLEIKPLDVKRCLSMKAHNDPCADPSNGDRPTHGRSDSLYYAKKALSHFMPHRTVPWCNGQGNPTKSAAVKCMIKEVKKFKVRGEGAKSNAKRPLKQVEFRKTLDLFRRNNDFNHKWRYPMMALWQCHLIGRVDDVSNFKVNDPKGHGDFDFALKTKVRWSKNVMEERQCPPQTLLGAADPTFCLLLNFGVHLETMLGLFPTATYLFTDSVTDNAVKNLIATYRNRLEACVWKHGEFRALETEDDDEGVGTHSHRKFPSNYARGCGAAPDEIEIRGRWKSQGHRVVFRYIDVKQLTVDAKVAALLCVGGPIKCKFKSGVTLTDEFLFENVVPNIRARYPNDSRLCRVLATAILFGAMDEEIGESLMPVELRDRITQAHLPTHPAIQQPVKRVPLTVCRIQDTLMIDEVPQLDDDEPTAPGGNGAPPQPTAGANTQHTAQVLVNLQRPQQQQASNHQQQQDSLAGLRQWAVNQFRVVNNNIRAFGGTIESAAARQDPQQGARRRRATDPQRQVQDGSNPATLAPTPRTFQELWEEYQFGIGGRKPAKDFTGPERGNRQHGIKQKCYRRKFVWWTIEEMVRSGNTRQAAINRIRSAYGYRCSVTQIINFMIGQHKNGGNGHPNLVSLRSRLRRASN